MRWKVEVREMEHLKENYVVPDMISDLVLASSDEGLIGISNKLSGFLSLPIIITDMYYNVLATSTDQDSLEIVVSTHFESQQNSAFFKCSLDLLGQGYESFGHPIKQGNQNYGYLFFLNSHANQDRLEKYEALIQYTASLCTLYLKQLSDLKKERHRFKDAFLYDILYGNFKNKEDIISYGSIWKWEFDQPHMAIVFSIIDYNHYSADRQLIETLLYIIEKTLIQNGMEPIIIKKQNEVIAILPANDKTYFHQKKKLIDFVSYSFNQAKETNLGNRLACGIGQIYDNPVELYRSYQEAKVAYELGLLLKIEIPFFHNLGLERVLYKHDLQDLKEFYQHVMGELQKYDDMNGSELMDTLESFASHQFDLKQTSEAIFLHRNTLRYRIKKIEEILNVKLDDINNRLNIAAAFKIKLLHKL